MELKYSINNTETKIIIEPSILEKVSSFLNTDRKVLIVTDYNIPTPYYLDAFKDFNNLYILCIKPGEKSKNYKNYLRIQEMLINKCFNRDDYIVSFGGGVVSDLTGFVASTYKRGMNWINVPTSTLAMIDASVGGKVAINYRNHKNIIGAFYNPMYVFIDTKVLESLPVRHYYNGLFEALKMGYLYDSTLVHDIRHDVYKSIDDIIKKSIMAKISIIKADFKDEGKRHELNFGHTFGHAYESYFGFSDTLLHGEAIAYGMKKVVNKALLPTLNDDFEILHLKEVADIPLTNLLPYIKNDKKNNDGMINIVFLQDFNKPVIVKKTIEEIEKEQ